jgi:hypothetical protein
MRKLKLDLEELAVDSFDVVAEGTHPRGTVRGAEDTLACSWRNSCVDSCQLSCTGSCYTGLNCQQVC